ncbi:MAG: hypothetical protein WCQ50_08455 [Spirochaetota bacterium]
MDGVREKGMLVHGELLGRCADDEEDRGLHTGGKRGRAGWNASIGGAGEGRPSSVFRYKSSERYFHRSGKRDPEHEKLYEKHYEVSATPVRGVKVVPKQEAIDLAERDYGHFALISNDIKDPNEALKLYRSKDLWPGRQPT